MVYKDIDKDGNLIAFKELHDLLKTMNKDKIPKYILFADNVGGGVFIDGIWIDHIRRLKLDMNTTENELIMSIEDSKDYKQF